MKKILLMCIILQISTYAIAGTEVSTIKICTPEWEYYTQKDGVGLYHELWKEIYEPAGVKPIVSYIPYKRCKIEVPDAQKKYVFDAYPGGYKETTPGLKPKWHIGIDLLTVAYKKNSNNKWNDQASLENKIVAWQRGFSFDKYGTVKVKVSVQEFDKLKSALKMLSTDRIDFILDYEYAIEKFLKELNLANQVVVVPSAITGPKYYMIFQQTERGRELAEIWDKGMERLHKSGKLQKMYEAYGDKSY